MQQLWSLRVVTLDGATHSRWLLSPQQPLTVGCLGCDIVLQHVSVDEKHAEFSLVGGRCFLRSTNASCNASVNGALVNLETELNSGDVCTMGVQNVLIHVCAAAFLPFSKLEVVRNKLATAGLSIATNMNSCTHLIESSLRFLLETTRAIERRARFVSPEFVDKVVAALGNLVPDGDDFDEVGLPSKYLYMAHCPLIEESTVLNGRRIYLPPEAWRGFDVDFTTAGIIRSGGKIETRMDCASVVVPDEQSHSNFTNAITICSLISAFDVNPRPDAPRLRWVSDTSFMRPLRELKSVCTLTENNVVNYKRFCKNRDSTRIPEYISPVSCVNPAHTKVNIDSVCQPSVTPQTVPNTTEGSMKKFQSEIFRKHAKL